MSEEWCDNPKTQSSKASANSFRNGGLYLQSADLLSPYTTRTNTKSNSCQRRLSACVRTVTLASFGLLLFAASGLMASLILRSMLHWTTTSERFLEATQRRPNEILESGGHDSVNSTQRSIVQANE